MPSALPCCIFSYRRTSHKHLFVWGSLSKCMPSMQGLKVALVFLISHFLFCELQPNQCLNAWTTASALTVSRWFEFQAVVSKCLHLFSFLYELGFYLYILRLGHLLPTPAVTSAHIVPLPLSCPHLMHAVRRWCHPVFLGFAPKTPAANCKDGND